MDSDELKRRAGEDHESRFHVVVPLAAGENLTAARERLEMQLGLIEELGLIGTGEIGDTDPLIAIETALAREPASGVVLSTFPPRLSRWQRANVPSGLARRINIPFVVVHDDEPEF